MRLIGVVGDILMRLRHQCGSKALPKVGRQREETPKGVVGGRGESIKIKSAYKVPHTSEQESLNDATSNE